MKYSTIFLVKLGIVSLLLTIISQVIFELPNMLVLVLLNVSTILIIIGVINSMKGDKGPIHDERTKKLSMIGLSYSWLSTIVLLSLVFWIDYFTIIKFNISQLIGVISFWMIFSAIILQTIFKKRGDISNL
jgi:hypothetical protein